MTIRLVIPTRFIKQKGILSAFHQTRFHFFGHLIKLNLFLSILEWKDFAYCAHCDTSLQRQKPCQQNSSH